MLYALGIIDAGVAEHPELPIAIHCDHGDTVDLIQTCIKDGYTSVMIDGSHHEYEHNVKLTAEAMKVAHAAGVVLHELLTDQESVAEVAAARRVYGERQADLADGLVRHGVPATAGDGINTWIRVTDERTAMVQLAAAGIRVAGGAPFFSAPRDEAQYIRVTVGLIGDDADGVGAALAAVAIEKAI